MRAIRSPQSLEMDFSAFNKNQLDLFWWFVCERQTIWVRRVVERLPPPWTDDPVLQSERFTNVYRELDPGTRYAIEQILERDVPRPDKIFNVMLYRLIGRADTHREIAFQRLDRFSGNHLRRALRQIRQSGRSPFTAAYMVSAYTSMGTRDKIENVARLFERLATDFQSTYLRIDQSQSAQQVHTVLASMYGFGDFLAYQVLVDLLYPLRIYGHEPLLPYSHDDWARAGPGARRGIEMILAGSMKQKSLSAPAGEGVGACPEQRRRALPREHTEVLPYHDWSPDRNLGVMRWLRDHQDNEFHRLGLDFSFLTDPEGESIPLTLANIQNCLCEFHKYVKIRDGTGRGRRKFIPSEIRPV